MNIPFIDLKRFEDNILEDWQEKVKQMTLNTAFISGPEVEQLEKHIQQNCQTKHAISCANGTDAIQIALRAVGVSRNDYVLLPDATFWATFEAIVNVGANPVPVDINKDDLQMDYDLFVKAAQEYKPKAAILVHLYGWGTSRLEDYRKYCKDHDIKLIEDGAQSYKVKYKDESIYKNSLISTISFYPAKVYGAAGEAGAIVCSDDDLAAIARSLANHGRSQHYSYQYIGWNSRMDALQAAWLNIAQPHLDKRIESRRTSAQFYRENLKDCDSFEHVALPQNYTENGYLNCLKVKAEKRDKICEYLKNNNIGFGIVYPEPMSIQIGAKDFLNETFNNPVALQMSKSVLSLPLFAYMTQAELEYVKKIFLEAVEKA